MRENRGKRLGKKPGEPKRSKPTVHIRPRLGGGPFSKVDPRKFTLIQGSIF